MNLRVRRIYRTGKSIAITLPPDWLRGNDLGPGDEIEIWYDGEIRIRKRAKSKPEPARVSPPPPPTIP